MYIAAERNYRDIVDLLLMSSGSIMEQEIQDGNSIFHINFSLMFNSYITVQFEKKIIIISDTCL